MEMHSLKKRQKSLGAMPNLETRWVLNLHMGLLKYHLGKDFCRGKSKLHVLVNEYEDGAIVEQFHV